MNPMINFTEMPQHEVFCIGNVNQTVLYAFLMISLGFLFTKAINIEKIIKNKTGEDLDTGMLYSLTIILVSVCLMVVSYFAII